MFFARKRSANVAAAARCGHEGVITGRDAFSLRSSTADPRGVAQPPLQSTYSHCYVLKIALVHNRVYI
ncbi:hypothetical protein [Lysinibacillus sp. NPDC056232]|uniref:hypothetical protein n=1 Tax=Lysinibacillus sp. NPDC056232 TaxID=3345756 RepID=UPI0035D60B5D